LINQKVEGKEVTVAAPEAPRAQVIDLMEALKESLAKRVSSGEKRPRGKPKRPPPPRPPRQASRREEVAFGGPGVRMGLGRQCPESPSNHGSRSNTCRSSTAMATSTPRSSPSSPTRI